MKDAPALDFPPLMWGEATEDGAMEHATRRAVENCDAGLIAYRLGADQVEAAVVLAPEVPLDEAMTMLPLCAVALQNALGALAPPEVAVHLAWDGGVLVNGALCGRFAVRSATDAPREVPDWLVVGWELRLLPDTPDPGTTPDETALLAEGCGDVMPPALVESWARHALNWIARWEDEGVRALAAEWQSLSHGIGAPATRDGVSGTFLGIDETFGMLLQDASRTHLIPLTTLLEDRT